MLTVFALTVLVLAALAAESVLVRRRLRAIPIRVHVGGTRGKSTVTRLITAALRQSGHRVIGKITGVLPTILEPDGSVTPIRRRGPARVHEQIGMVHRASRLRCDAIVLECMSIAPELQHVEASLLAPTLSILTNIRDDHREEFGASPNTHIDGFCAFVPAQGMLVSGEMVHADAVDRRMSARRTRIIRPGHEDADAARSLPVEAHGENVLLALAACRTLGISTTDAVEGIRGCLESLEHELIRVPGPDGELRFLNGFAVNDPPSAQLFIESWRERLEHWETTTIVLNTRADRPLRSVQFARWCACLRDLRHVVVLGDHAPRAHRALRSEGVPGSRVTIWSERETADPGASLAALKGNATDVVVGVGNISGAGLTIVERLRR